MVYQTYFKVLYFLHFKQVWDKIQVNHLFRQNCFNYNIFFRGSWTSEHIWWNWLNKFSGLYFQNKILVLTSFQAGFLNSDKYQSRNFDKPFKKKYENGNDTTIIFAKIFNITLLKFWKKSNFLWKLKCLSDLSETLFPFFW